jgi:hypothetical protein
MTCGDFNYATVRLVYKGRVLTVNGQLKSIDNVSVVLQQLVFDGIPSMCLKICEPVSALL